jgi:hypothetical protein
MPLYLCRLITSTTALTYLSIYLNAYASLLLRDSQSCSHIRERTAALAFWLAAWPCAASSWRCGVRWHGAAWVCCPGHEGRGPRRPTQHHAATAGWRRHCRCHTLILAQCRARPRDLPLPLGAGGGSGHHRVDRTGAGGCGRQAQAGTSGFLRRGDRCRGGRGTLRFAPARRPRTPRRCAAVPGVHAAQDKTRDARCAGGAGRGAGCTTVELRCSGAQRRARHHLPAGARPPLPLPLPSPPTPAWCT